MDTESALSNIESFQFYIYSLGVDEPKTKLIRNQYANSAE